MQNPSYQVWSGDPSTAAKVEWIRRRASDPMCLHLRLSSLKDRGGSDCSYDVTVPSHNPTQKWLLFINTSLPRRSPKGITRGWDQMSRLSCLLTHPRYFPGTQSPHEKHLPKSDKGNASQSVNKKRQQEQRCKHTSLEWQAGGLALHCSGPATSGLCSGGQSHKVTVLHLSAARGKKHSVNCRTHQKSNLSWRVSEETAEVTQINTGRKLQ